MTATRYSLRWRLVVRLAVMQAVVVLLVVAVLLVELWRAGWIPDAGVMPAIEDSIQYEGTDLIVEPSAGLRDLRSQYRDLWFVVEDGHGNSAVYGAAPGQYTHRHRLEAPEGFGHIQIDGAGGRAPDAYFNRIERNGETLSVIAGIKGRANFSALVRTLAGVTLVFTLPLVVLITLMLVLATTVIVQGAFHPLRMIADQARRITITDRGVRLTPHVGPVEIAPLIQAINDALDRLDDGYARRARFLADAAHELRTPVAIIQTRLDGLPRNTELQPLRRDVARLAGMAEQMLDLQRIEAAPASFRTVDLATLARNVAADLAPYVKANDGDLSLEIEAAGTRVQGDSAALERAVANLVHNALEHGGPTIVIHVLSHAIEVWDDGPGIPEEDRERVFEPFFRRIARSTGSGLGLSLVQQIARVHGGRASAHVAPGGGTIMRVTFPAEAREPKTLV